MSEKKEEKKSLYEVQILRIDGEHIIAAQSENYDECFEKWENLHKLWRETSDENKPFVLTEPKVTAFNPTLIKEITLVPVVEQAEGKYSNPYQREMLRNGLSETLNKYRGPQAPQPQGDLLDGGYK